MFQDDGKLRVLEGPDGADDAVAGGEFDLTGDIVRIKFKKFVKEFASAAAGSGGIQFTQKYREQFMQNVNQGINCLSVSLSDLNVHEDGGVLNHNLRQNPTEFVPMCEKALQELYLELIKRDGDELPNKSPPIQLRLTTDTDLDGQFGTVKPLMIRDLISTEVEKLVVVQGIVSSMRPLRQKARKIVLKCSSCENQKEVYVSPGFCAAHIPASCDGNSARGGVLEKCPPNPFVVIDDLCEYVDEQSLKLQELPEHVPVGEMPRGIDLCVQNYNVDQCTPGSRLTCVGIFCATEHAAGEKIASSRQRGTNTVKYSYIQVLGIEVAQGNMVGKASIGIKPEEAERFEAMAKSVDDPIRQKIFSSIAPAIRASEKDVIKDVKQAVACLLFGGSRKQLPDGTRMRGDINVLMLGDPGTAKSQFLKFAEKCAPIAVYTSGKGSSAAGLTASIRKDKDGFLLEGGAMVLADGGVVCIDEFDKMDVKDRVAIHEAMEQQTISIAKAGITTMLNTRCSVLAAANPRFGSYDDLTNTADQMDFETTILSRFDMIFLVKDVRDPERDHGLAMHLASLHTGEVQDDAEGPLNASELRKYISYCRNKCQPRLSKEASDTLKNHYVSIRKEMRKEAKSAIPITVRQLEAIVRMSESLAKMELIEDVSINHVEEALRLFTVSTLDSANKDRGVGIDTLSEAETEELQKAEEQIKKIIPRGSRKNKFTLQSLIVSTTGIDERIANKAIYKMQMRGELIEKANGTLQRAS
jgi:DNA replication licensing factor MCM5